jgi:hypothetical protein
VRLTRPMLVVSGLLGLSACQGGFFSRSRPAPEVACPPHEAATATVEFQQQGFDGQTLTGRLLLGAKSGSLCLDRRLIESFTLTVERATDCATVQPLGFLVVDVRAPARRQEDVLLLAPGQWYGRDVSVPLFQQPGFACADVELSVHALDASHIGTLRFRATRPEPTP